MATDLAQAYFNAPSTSSVFVDLCEENRGPEEEGVCGELSVAMYGTRSAARNWQKSYTDLLCNCVCRVACGNTCMFAHQECDVVVLVLT